MFNYLTKFYIYICHGDHFPIPIMEDRSPGSLDIGCAGQTNLLTTFKHIQRKKRLKFENIHNAIVLVPLQKSHQRLQNI